MGIARANTTSVQHDGMRGTGERKTMAKINGDHQRGYERKTMAKINGDHHGGYESEWNGREGCSGSGKVE